MPYMLTICHEDDFTDEYQFGPFPTEEGVEQVIEALTIVLEQLGASWRYIGYEPRVTLCDEPGAAVEWVTNRVADIPKWDAGGHS